VSLSPETSAPLIVTLKLDDTTFSWANHLRQEHFPPERNVLPAHVTLFHALPGKHVKLIQTRLNHLGSETPKLSLHFRTLRFLGKGVAIEVQSHELIQLRQRLATDWHDWLTSQDRQVLRPHITIQNKVTPDEARQTYENLSQEWHPIDGYGEGLLLWSYQGGPWQLVGEYLFQATPQRA